MISVSNNINDWIIIIQLDIFFFFMTFVNFICSHVYTENYRRQYCNTMRKKSLGI